MVDLHGAAETAVTQCAALEGPESCVVVTDERRRSIGRALYAAADSITGEAVLLEYPAGDTHGSEPPGPVAAAMRSGDVVFAPTSASLTHTRARTDATDAGARVATLPGITEGVFQTGLDADYDRIATHCERVHDRIAGAAELRVTTEAGTDATFDIKGRDLLMDTGIVHEPGTVTNLPAGEVFVSPRGADGTVVVDGTMQPHGLLDADRPIRLELTNGRVSDISDPALEEVVEEAAAEGGEAAYNVAELGIGTNVGVTHLGGNVLLDEKAAGTVHVAIGDDAGIGGDVDAPIHLDGVVREPTVYADGTRVELPRPG